MQGEASSRDSAAEGTGVPAFSVVIPYFNRSRSIAAALASVRAQTLAPLEIIVIDDGSRADEAEALTDQAGDAVVIRLCQNRGPSAARNAGIARARGDWIAFLDSDDVWHPRKLALQADVIRAHPACRAVHGGIVTIYPGGREAARAKTSVELEDFLVFPCPILPSAVVMHRESLIESGLFDTTKRCCEDLDLFMRFVRTHGQVRSVAEMVVTRRIQDDSLSRDIGTFWREADRTYRDFLPVLADHFGPVRARQALRAVYTEMALMAIYARDLGLLARMIGPARLGGVPYGRVLGGAALTVVKNRLLRH